MNGWMDLVVAKPFCGGTAQSTYLVVMSCHVIAVSLVCALLGRSGLDDMSSSADPPTRSYKIVQGNFVFECTLFVTTVRSARSDVRVKIVRISSVASLTYVGELFVFGGGGVNNVDREQWCALCLCLLLIIITIIIIIIIIVVVVVLLLLRRKEPQQGFGRPINRDCISR